LSNAPLIHALQSVRAACELVRNVQAELVSEDVVAKADRSPVTVADLSAQAVISSMLGVHFPHIPLLAEEDDESFRDDPELAERILRHVAAVLGPEHAVDALEAIKRGRHPGGAGQFWVLDPIDGTEGFLRNDQYAVCLALLDRGKVQLAVLGCPNLPLFPGRTDSPRGVLAVAARGEGASIESLDGSVRAPCRVSQVADSAEATLIESLVGDHTDHGRQQSIAAVLGLERAPLRMDSQAKFVAVARGEADLYLRFSGAADFKQKIWDIAAGALLVEEAGGQVSDAQGRPLDFTLGRDLGLAELYATNGLLHAQVRDAIQKTREQS